MKIEKIIIRREPARNGGNLCVFFPDTVYRGSRGKWVECFSFNDGHSIASYSYYLECAPCDYLEDPEPCELAERYERYIQSLPDCKDIKIKLVKKIMK